MRVTVQATASRVQHHTRRAVHGRDGSELFSP